VIWLPIAVGPFSVAGGHTTIVDLRLSRHGKERLAQADPLTVRAITLASDPAGLKYASHQVAKLRQV
jgi:hypothetical protein